jgi:hypothetical protein
MATTTPNYGWPVPTSTDYVKDGATAIEALGDAIDATVFGLGSAGLILVKTQTIGAAVSNVTVTGAFSATYDNYLITVSGGVGSVANYLKLQLGATTTGYYYGGNYALYAGGTGTLVGANVANWIIGNHNSNEIDASVRLFSPNLTKLTTYAANFAEGGTAGLSAHMGGMLNNTTQYTDFTLIPLSGTLTGGEIKVYGFEK